LLERESFLSGRWKNSRRRMKSANSRWQRRNNAAWKFKRNRTKINRSSQTSRKPNFSTKSRIWKIRGTL